MLVDAPSDVVGNVCCRPIGDVSGMMCNVVVIPGHMLYLLGTKERRPFATLRATR